MGVRIYDSNTREEIMPEEARAQALDKRAYDQNYECSFADENLTLLSHELITAAERNNAGFICEQDWGNVVSRPIPRRKGQGTDEAVPSSLMDLLLTAHGSLYVGFDVGRKVDLSVITVMEDLNGLKVVRGILRIQNMRLPEQQLRLGEICRLPKFRRAAIDMTGLGLGLFEYAQKEFGSSRIFGVNFSTTVPVTRAVALEGRKRETVRVTEAMAMELLQVYEDRRIQHPADGRLRDDLRKPEKITTPGGRVSIAATRDEAGHADHFWSFALALEAAGSAGGEFRYRAVAREQKGVVL
jgi:phage FluMu gp28-like protein